jgi:hypothetical protein
MHKTKRKVETGNQLMKKERERGKQKIDRNEGMVRSLVTYRRKFNVPSSDCN